MRDRIAEILKTVEVECTPCCSGTMEEAEALDCSAKILSQIREEVEKMENPYRNLRAGPIQEDAFDYFRRTMLSILV